MPNYQEENPFLAGPILPALIKFAIPIFLATVLQAMYSAVDLWVVGRFLGPADISAVATGSMVVHTITLTIIGLSMGSTIYIGHKYGAKDFTAAANIIGNTFWIFAILSVIFSALIVLGAPTIGIWVNAPPEALAKTTAYIRICGGGIVFISAYNVISALFRGLGNSKYPLLFVFIASLANIIGDLLLVAVFKMDSSGTAIATVIAQALSVLLSLALIKKKGFSFPVNRDNFRIQMSTIKHILKLGMPLALQNLCNGISFTIIIAIVNTLGIIASAGMGVSERIFNFMYMIPSAVAPAIAAFTAQNIGAKQHIRAKDCFKLSLKGSTITGLAIFGLVFFQGSSLAAIFTDDPQVVIAASDFLRATAFECLFISFAYCFLGYYNGIGLSSFVMIQGLVATFIVRIPLAYLASIRPQPSMFEFGLSAAIAALCTLLFYIAFYIFGKKQIQNKIESFAD